MLGTRPLALLFAGLLAACGGSTASIDAGTTNDGGTTNDAGGSTDAATSPCPTSPPTGGAACSTPAVCEYGTSPNRACNIVATCTGSTWTLSAPANCNTKNPPKCPSTYASVPRGQSCSDGFPTDCVYPEGLCSCTVAAGPVPLDASASATWICDAPGNPKCPSPRPKLGTACNANGLLCDYGACVFPDGTAMNCEGGFWNQADVPCPL
jgi:hypothetical protein